MTEKKIEIRRAVGALAWPGSAAGSVVILGQEYRHIDQHPNQGEIQVLYHLVHFFESDDLSQLLETARELNWKHGCMGFYARLSHKSGVDFLQLWNREQMKKGRTLFHLAEAPMTQTEEHHRKGSIEAHLSLLREYLRPEKKRLIGLRGTKLAAYLNEIPRQATKLKDLDHPSVAALGYALAALVPTEYYDREQAEAESYLRELEEFDD